MIKNIFSFFRLALPVLIGFYTCNQGFSQATISPPPNSASVAKMIDNPVDLSTGVPKISLSLHTIHGRKLSYPISISYNASGIKVAEIAGTTGLGWSLSCEAILTRTVKGRPDEWPNSYFQFASAIPNDTDVIPSTTLYSLANGNYDMQPDLFYYNTGIDAGKFVFDNQLIPQTIPKKQVKISFDNTSTLAEAMITNYDGTKLLFIGGETSTVTAIFGSSSYKSSWYLSKIISADNSDTIKFNYTTSAASTYAVTKNGFLYFYYDVPAGGANKAQYEVEQTFGSKAVSVSGTKYLESIESSKGKVVFQYGIRTDKADLKKLDALVIYRKDPVNTQLIEEKRINFAYSYFLETFDGSRLRLDNVQELTLGTITKPPYQFLYSTKKLPPIISAAQDPWGYYNGALSNTSLVPAMTFLGQTISTSDRQIHAEFVDGFIISKITTPLGGTTEYFFEPNRYGASNANGPGLRISKIVNKDPYSNINAVTNYEYLNPATGASSGVLLEQPSFSETHIPVEDIHHGVTLNYFCMLKPIHATGAGAYASTPLVYEYVTVYEGDSYNVSGKTTSRFSIASATPQVYPYFPETDNTWKLGDVKEIKHYKVEAGTPTIVGFSENTFTDHPTYTTIKGLNVAWNKLYIIQTPQVSSLAIKNYIQESKFPYLSESKVYTYEQNSATISSVNTQNFYYERTDGYYLPNRVTTKTSESTNTLQKEFTYPVDYPATGVFGAMQSLNMISYPVEEKSVLIKGANQYITGYQKTDYSQWTTSGIYPSYIYRGKFSSPVLRSTFLTNPSSYLQLSMLINQYDNNGYPVESEQQGGIPSAVIIDQKQCAPVAQVTNARLNQIAFSSFETSDNGNWNVNAGSEARTGSRTLNTNGGVTSFSINAPQNIAYTYTVTQSAGPRPILTFSRIGTTDIDQTLTLSSGSGSVSLGAGTWNASLSFDTHVTSVSVTFTYPYTHYFAPNILTTDSKTGARSLTFTTTHTVSKTSLPSGDYVVSYFQKGGTLTLSLTGAATILGTETVSAGADGWEHVKKTIRITSVTDAVQLTGNNIKADELRLYPVGAMMSTTCFDSRGRAHTVTDVNLRSQFYEYDEWGRLKTLRDHDKNILQHSEYKFGSN